VRDVVVKANGMGLCGNLPFRGAEEDGDVTRVNFRDARRNRCGFERVVNGGEENGFASDVNDGAAAGEVGDDFVFLCMKRDGEKQAELEKAESQRILTISYLIDLSGEEGSGRWFPRAVGSAKLRSEDQQSVADRSPSFVRASRKWSLQSRTFADGNRRVNTFPERMELWDLEN